MTARLVFVVAMLVSGCASHGLPSPVVVTRPVDASLPPERRYVPIRADLTRRVPDPVSGRRLVLVSDWYSSSKLRAAALATCNVQLDEIAQIQGRPVSDSD